MNEQIAQMGPLWVLAELSAGWLTEHLMTRGGLGFTRDMGLGVSEH
jgi:hypothetical protein